MSVLLLKLVKYEVHLKEGKKKSPHLKSLKASNIALKLSNVLSNIAEEEVLLSKQCSNFIYF